MSGQAAPVAVRVVESGPGRIELRLTFAPPELFPVEIDGAEYFQPVVPGEAVMLGGGAPALPKVVRSVAIADDVGLGLAVGDSRFEEVALAVPPSKGNLLRSTDPASVPYEFGPEYERDEFFPGPLARLGEPYILRDQRGVAVEFFPCQYNPVTGILRVYRQITVALTPGGPGRVNVLDRASQGKQRNGPFARLYRERFVNFAPGPRGGTRYDALSEEGEMLIICHDPWLPNIAPFAQHKLDGRIPTLVVGVSVVGNSGAAIRSYIQNVYDTTDLAYVLLVGDSVQVRTMNASGGASDPSYTKLAGADDYPDVIIGRFSAETAGQVDTQVQRTMAHELGAAHQQGWFQSATGIASLEGDGIGDEGQADWVHMDEIREWLLADGRPTVDRLYDPSATAEMVSAALNAGRGVINYCGHGERLGWVTTSFAVEDIAALTNVGRLPVIFSVACVNGQFAGVTCFAEEWLRSTRDGQPIGAVATYMSSINQAWAPPMEAQDEFNRLLCADAYGTFGGLCFAGSCAMLDAYGAAGVSVFDTWHIFGDPSLRICEPAGPGGLLGDLNCDGSRNALDINPFVLALTNLPAYLVAHPDCDPMHADANGDGTLSGLDIEPFTRLLGQ